MNDQTAFSLSLQRNIWRKLAWVALGIGIGLILAAIYFAYGQPELLLEQMNLRYCG